MQKVFRPIEYIIFAVVLVFLSWATLHFIGDTLSQKHEYASLPTDLQLKSDPKNIIYSEAYRDKNGDTEIKYAYTGDVVVPDEGEDIARRTPSSQTYVLETFEDEEGRPAEKLKTVFIPKPQFYEDADGWRQIQYATTTQKIFSRSGAIKHIKQRELAERFFYKLFGIKPVFAATSTFYPNADTETTSVDGHVQSYVSSLNSTSWSTARNAATGIFTSDSGTTVIASALFNYSGTRGDFGETSIFRAFLLFDTSALGSEASISSATLSIYVTSKVNTDNDGEDTIGVYTSTPASNTSLADADVDQVGSTAQATAVDISSVSTSAYYNFSLNATGLSNISKTSITKFGLREGHDISGTILDDNTSNSVTSSSADFTGTSQDPKLEVTYTISSYSFGQWFPF